MRIFTNGAGKELIEHDYEPAECPSCGHTSMRHETVGITRAVEKAVARADRKN